MHSVVFWATWEELFRDRAEWVAAASLWVPTFADYAPVSVFQHVELSWSWGQGKEMRGAQTC